MEFWQALILGIVEGLTEYLPVSSTGHLLVVQHLIGVAPGEAANAYAIIIQAGAIVAVLGVFRQRVRSMLEGLRGRDPQGRQLLLCLAAAFVPAAALGLAANDAIERWLFGPWPVVVAWALGGALLLVIAPRMRQRPGASLEQLGWRAALFIGAAQCVAMWPGVSRSLATILGGLAVGLSLTAAVEFSFLLGLVTLSAATGYAALKSGTVLLESYGVPELVVGFVAAWISGVLAVRWMLAWLQARGFELFGWWRLAAAGAVGAYLLLGGAP